MIVAIRQVVIVATLHHLVQTVMIRQVVIVVIHQVAIAAIHHHLVRVIKLKIKDRR
jgi:hypothetical protein